MVQVLPTCGGVEGGDMMCVLGGMCGLDRHVIESICKARIAAFVKRSGICRILHLLTVARLSYASLLWNALRVVQFKFDIILMLFGPSDFRAFLFADVELFSMNAVRICIAVTCPAILVLWFCGNFPIFVCAVQR